MSQESKIKAFVAYSFLKEDKELIDKFLKYFDSRKDILTWEHAKDPQPKSISKKIKELMENKDLFIGIFTKKYTLGIFRKRWLPSLWIIQESGYAIGKNIKLLLLVEDIIDRNEITGLQGDYELISFSRKKPEESFGSINHMLYEISKESLNESETIPVVQREVKEQQEDKKRSKLDLFGELIVAIEEKDLGKEEEIYNELTKGCLSEEVKKWETYRMGIKARYGDKEAFNKLKDKADKEFLPALNLGRYYKSVLKDYPQAESYFRKALEYAQNFDYKLEALEELSMCLCSMNDINASYNVVVSFLNSSTDFKNEEIGSIYRLLAKIAKLNKDKKLFLSFSEKVLALNPHDNSLRFDLAYEYSELKMDEMALHHYKILLTMNPSGAVYNNLGVSYTNLGISGLSINSYIKQ